MGGKKFAAAEILVAYLASCGEQLAGVDSRDRAEQQQRQKKGRDRRRKGLAEDKEQKER